MSDQLFELRLERAARRIADEAVRPTDAVAIAEAAIRAAGRADEIAAPRFGARGPWLALAIAASAIVFAVVGSLVLDRSRHDAGTSPSPSIGSSPSSSPSPNVTAAPVGVPAGGASGGTWLADVPAGLVFDVVAPTSRMALNVSGLTASVDLVGGTGGLFMSSFITENVGEVRLTSDAASERVTVDGAPLAPCSQGDEGRYQTTSSPDGLLLTFALISDPCPSRAAVIARTWTRSISVPNGGGIGVVDGFDPLFTVVLPAGSYAVDDAADAKTIHQDLPELQFVSWKDPQGFLDPCDRSKGRYEIAPGADAFVAYVRQLAGFTVDSTAEVTVDGHRAIRLVVHADADATCPGGQLWEWQPKAETSDHAWFLRPGVTDSLYIVEHPKGTLMFEVLPAPNPLEDQLIGSIHFLDALPTTP
jgi:hypothetical protein